ncbi:NAD(P)/FAD-dependent oxidoreductase [Roseateles albus]|uniref:NAD(P)/FAD-dependent oxidoreductase n=1 Tax=Roseateles albus TaxID=2987525 RepID=A0ABT5KMR7_9BURK|nr:NAD(P)/FAD-dependent oxidoreductase [Roseateles albus]MDC8774210.1 NAD(P)/FAD-dependent oxidoreductase [Roseateles albus]
MKTPNALQADVIMVGAGPAGIAALQPLLAAGRSVIWIDQAGQAGGQIWRAGVAQPWAKQLAVLLPHSGLRRLFGHAVIDADRPSEGSYRLRLQNLAEPTAAALLVQAPQLLLALGARERFLPFPGWTLPGVSGAGGLQALVKSGWPVAGQRVVLAGSGPLLLAAADSARAAGAQITLVAEQASRRALAGFAARLTPAKAAQAAGLAWRLRATPYRSGSWVVKALGQQRLEGVVLSNGRTQWELPCEALGVAYGLLPNIELAELLGCRIEAGAIDVDATLQTSLPGVYAAGECTGIGGVDKALIEGQLVARALLGHSATPALRRQKAQAERFAKTLAATFKLRPELLTLADAKTIICRCEDVTLAELKGQRSWRDAKLQTRCGMGACQGRICGPITQTMLGWPEAQSGRGGRAPLQPTPLACLLDD